MYWVYYLAVRISGRGYKLILHKQEVQKVVKGNKDLYKTKASKVEDYRGYLVKLRL